MTVVNAFVSPRRPLAAVQNKMRSLGCCRTADTDQSSLGPTSSSQRQQQGAENLERHEKPSTITKQAAPKKGCLKVATVEESLRSRRDGQRGSSRLGRLAAGGPTLSFLAMSPTKNSLKRSKGTPWSPASAASQVFTSFWKSSTKKNSDTDGSDHAEEEQEKETIRRKSVDFGQVEVREYGAHLGCNPGGKGEGAALTIGWSYSEREPQQVDDFEWDRGPAKTLGELRLSEEEREERLRRSGYTKWQIRRGAWMRNRAKRRRAKTLKRLHMADHEEAVEEAFAKVKKSLYG